MVNFNWMRSGARRLKDNMKFIVRTKKGKKIIKLSLLGYDISRVIYNPFYLIEIVKRELIKSIIANSILVGVVCILCLWLYTYIIAKRPPIVVWLYISVMILKYLIDFRIVRVVVCFMVGAFIAWVVFFVSSDELIRHHFHTLVRHLG